MQTCDKPQKGIKNMDFRKKRSSKFDFFVINVNLQIRKFTYYNLQNMINNF